MSLRKAIDEKCKDCIYDKGAPGTWRQQVAACTITSCSLHEYRPMMVPAKKAGFETKGEGVGSPMAGIRRLVRKVTKSGRKTDEESILDMEPA
jgi:hypothetical protein